MTGSGSSSSQLSNSYTNRDLPTPASPTTSIKRVSPSSIVSRVRLLQAQQLGVPANHARLHALDAARVQPEGARLGLLDDIDLHRFRLALDGQRLQGLDVEDAAHVAIGVVADEDGADRRGRLQPAGQIDGVAHGGELTLSSPSVPAVPGRC